MKKILIGMISATVGLNVAFAQTVGITFGANNNVGGSLSALIAMVQRLVNQLNVLAYGVAILAFFWFLIQVILDTKKGDATAKTNHLQKMGWSILALFLMYAIFGVIAFMSSTVGVSVGGSITPISIPTGPTN